MASAPIELNFYDENCEVVHTYRTFLKFGILEEATQLESVVEGKPAGEVFDAIALFVVKLFHGQFGVEDLREKAEMAEVLSILPSITARAQQFAGPVNFQKGRAK